RVVAQRPGVDRQLHFDLADVVLQRGSGFQVGDEPVPADFNEPVERAAGLQLVVDHEAFDVDHAHAGGCLPVGVDVRPVWLGHGHVNAGVDVFGEPVYGGAGGGGGGGSGRFHRRVHDFLEDPPVTVGGGCFDYEVVAQSHAGGDLALLPPFQPPPVIKDLDEPGDAPVGDRLATPWGDDQRPAPPVTLHLGGLGGGRRDEGG